MTRPPPRSPGRPSGHPCSRITDCCVQLHGGYGSMRGYSVARAWADRGVQSIFGGTTEIMKEIAGRGLGL